MPSTLRQYFRPDGIDVRLDFPWIDFPRLGPSAVGETDFDKLDWTSSLPTSAPALTVLTLVAVWALRHRGERRGGPWLSPLLAGAVVGGLGVVAIGHIANRYLTDLFPLVLIPGSSASTCWCGAGATGRCAGGGSRPCAWAAWPCSACWSTWPWRSSTSARAPNVPESLRAQWSGLRASLPGSYEPLWRCGPSPPGSRGRVRQPARRRRRV